MRAFNYCWRVLATGYCFANFGLGGLLLAVTILPLVRLLPGSADQKNRRARRVVHYTFRFFIWQMCLLGVMEIEIKDARRLLKADGCLVIANHPSLIDVVLLISLLPNASCIVKQDLWKNPFLMWVVAATGYVSNVGPELLLKACGEALTSGSSLIIFPEGTRTTAGKPLEFYRGAANIAVRCATDIVPVTIECAPPTLRKGERWYQVPPSKGCFTLSVKPVIDVAKLIQGIHEPALATRKLNDYLQDYYKGVLNYG